MLEPPEDVFLSNEGQGFHQRLREFSLRTGFEGAQSRLDLGNTALKLKSGEYDGRCKTEAPVASIKASALGA